MLKTNFPSIVADILEAAVSLQVDTNSPVVEEFKESLDKLRVDPTHLVGSTYYFKNLFLSTYPWCMKNNMYSVAAGLVEIKNQASTHDPKLKLTQTEGIMLVYAYIHLERWGGALAILHELADTPVDMDSSGTWVRTVTVILLR